MIRLGGSILTDEQVQTLIERGRRTDAEMMALRQYANPEGGRAATKAVKAMAPAEYWQHLFPGITASQLRLVQLDALEWAAEIWRAAEDGREWAIILAGQIAELRAKP